MRMNGLDDLVKDIQEAANVAEIDIVASLTMDFMCERSDKSVLVHKVAAMKEIGISFLNEEGIKYFFSKDNMTERILDSLCPELKISKKSMNCLKEKYKGEIFSDEECDEVKKNILKEIEEIEAAYHLISQKNYLKEEKIIIRYQKFNFFSVNNSNLSDCRKYYYINECTQVSRRKVHNSFMCRSKEELISYIKNRKLEYNRNTSCARSVSVASGKYDIILPAGCGSLFFHECVGHLLEIQNAYNSDSIFGDKIGQRISNSQLNLVDDPTIEGLWGSYRLDDTGVVSKKTILIEKGVLKNFLVDKYFGCLHNLPVTSSSRRESCACMPVARMSNTFIENGIYERDEIYASMENGIIINEMDMGHVDPLTGLFLIHVKKGELISEKARKGYIYDLNIRTSALDVLKNIEMIGNDLKFSNGFCVSSSGKIPVSGGQPTIKIRNVYLDTTLLTK